MTFDCYLQMDCKKRWKSLLVLAIDGSTCSLPSHKAIESFFSVHSINKFGVKRYKARVLMVYDVLNKCVLSAMMSKMRFGEAKLLTNCIKQLTGKLSKHIYVMDRNFDGFCQIKGVLLVDPKAALCVRLSSRSGFFKRIMARPENDFTVEWGPSNTEKKNCRRNGLDTAPLLVRVTKVTLKTGEIEILVSNLMQMDQYTSDDLAYLYSLRWGVEEAFKNLKSKMKLEHFGCKKPRGVYQEFYAHIFMMNLVGLHGIIANASIEKKTAHRVHRYTYNWKNGYRFVRASLVKVMSKINNISKYIEWIIDHLQLSLIAIKPGRSFVRDMRWNEIKTRTSQYYK